MSLVRFLLRTCVVNARLDVWWRSLNGIGLLGMSQHRMDAATYKRLFSRLRMLRDLLHGFAARDWWSGALDLASDADAVSAVLEPRARPSRTAPAGE